jgi:hypothetical protein
MRERERERERTLSRTQDKVSKKSIPVILLKLSLETNKQKAYNNCKGSNAIAVFCFLLELSGVVPGSLALMAVGNSLP